MASSPVATMSPEVKISEILSSVMHMDGFESPLTPLENVGMRQLEDILQEPSPAEFEFSSQDGASALQEGEMALVEKLQRCESLQLPDDPLSWDSANVATWVQNMLHNYASHGESETITFQIFNNEVTGRTLAANHHQFHDIFGFHGEYVKRCFDNWVNDLCIRWKAMTEVNIGNQCLTASADQVMDIPAFWTPPHNPTDSTLDDIYIGNPSNFVDNSVNMFTYNSHQPTIPQVMTSLKYEDESIIALTTSPANTYCQNFPPSPESLHEPNDIYQHSSITSGSEVTDSESEGSDIDTKPVRKGPGRPPKQRDQIETKRRQPILYKFILECLSNPSYQGYVEWVNQSDGVFKFNSKRKDQFAALWSVTKGRKKQPMTYQNMARALRNYTRPNQGIMQRVPKKLHYKFTRKVFP